MKATRAKTKLSQTKFVAKLGVPIVTERNWEQDRRSPDVPAQTLRGMADAPEDGAGVD